MNSIFQIISHDLNTSVSGRLNSNQLEEIKLDLLEGKTFRVNGSDMSLVMIIIEKLAYPKSSPDRQCFHDALMGLLTSRSDVKTVRLTDTLKELIASDLHALATRILYQTKIH